MPKLSWLGHPGGGGCPAVSGNGPTGVSTPVVLAVDSCENQRADAAATQGTHDRDCERLARRHVEVAARVWRDGGPRRGRRRGRGRAGADAVRWGSTAGARGNARARDRVADLTRWADRRNDVSRTRPVARRRPVPARGHAETRHRVMELTSRTGAVQEGRGGRRRPILLAVLVREHTNQRDADCCSESGNDLLLRVQLGLFFSSSRSRRPAPRERGCVRRRWPCRRTAPPRSHRCRPTANWSGSCPRPPGRQPGWG